MTPPSSFLRDKRIPGLDGLRGIAAVIVLLSHLSSFGLFLFGSVSFSGIGKHGVYLFFVLSAFLLSSQMLAWQAEDFRDRRRWSNYFQGRIFRVWPLFLVVVLTCFITTMLPVFEGNGWPLTLDTKDFIYMLLLKRRDKFLWTIPVEFKFYFLLPLIMAVLVVTLHKRLVPTLVALIVAVAAAFAFIEPVGSSSSPIPFMGVFLSGILLAVVHKAMSTRSEAMTSVPSKLWPVLFEVVAWASAAAFVCTIPSVFGYITGRKVFTGHFHESLALFSAIWCLLILGMLHGKGLMRRLLEIPLLRGLGTVSYSLYLWHYGVVKLVSEHVGGPSWMKAWLAVLCSIAVAALSYYCIERPILQWSARRRSRALEATTEPAQRSELVTKSATS